MELIILTKLHLFLPNNTLHSHPDPTIIPSIPSISSIPNHFKVAYRQLYHPRFRPYYCIITPFYSFQSRLATKKMRKKISDAKKLRSKIS